MWHGVSMAWGEAVKAAGTAGDQPPGPWTSRHRLLAVDWKSAGQGAKFH